MTDERIQNSQKDETFPELKNITNRTKLLF